MVKKLSHYLNVLFMKYFSLLLFLTSLTTSYSAVAADAVVNTKAAAVEQLAQSLAKRMPSVKVTKISATPIDGLYQVLVGSQVVYMSSDSRYMIEGDLYDLQTKKNISDEAKSGVRLAAIEKLGADNMLIYTPAELANIDHRPFIKKILAEGQVIYEC